MLLFGDSTCHVFSGALHVISTMNPKQTIGSQLLDNVNDFIMNCLASQKGMTDEKRKLFGFVLKILITGNNIDWKIPNSVGHVCDILGVGRSTVFEYRKATSIDYKPPNRKRRSDALEEQLWWPQASCAMDTFWEMNCDESPNADDPAEKHDFTLLVNHQFVPLPENPEKTKRVCVGTYVWYIVRTFLLPLTHIAFLILRRTRRCL